MIIFFIFTQCLHSCGEEATQLPVFLTDSQRFRELWLRKLLHYLNEII